MVSTPGWQRFSAKIRQEAETIGLRAVYPGISDEFLKDNLTRANEALRIVLDVERKVAKREELEDKAAQVKSLP